MSHLCCSQRCIIFLWTVHNWSTLGITTRSTLINRNSRSRWLQRANIFLYLVYRLHHAHKWPLTSCVDFISVDFCRTISFIVIVLICIEIPQYIDLRFFVQGLFYLVFFLIFLFWLQLHYISSLLRSDPIRASSSIFKFHSLGGAGNASGP